MTFRRILVANRGEIAVRIIRAAAALGIETLAISAADEPDALHLRMADHARTLEARGAAAFLDSDRLVALARAEGCDAVHPGYGFLSESAAFAQLCAQNSITFIGPTPDMLEVLGDKARARALATELGIAVLPGSAEVANAEALLSFQRALPAGAALILKAVAGGGGRGMRVVRGEDDLEAAFAVCSAEAQAAFGNGALYAERYLERARHIEIQVIGDGTGAVTALHERECTVQRRHQKLLEMAPSPSLSAQQRAAMTADAIKMAKHLSYRGLGTFEFLLALNADGTAGEFWFCEANPRVQVEHTVTEAITGVDLVQAQIRIAAGASLADIGLAETPPAQGFAIQARLNAEVMGQGGGVAASVGTITRFEPPSGPGVRVDHAISAGSRISPAFDSLLAKIIVFGAQDSYGLAIKRLARALAECRIEGVQSNREFLLGLLQHPAVRENRIHTRFIEEESAAIAALIPQAPHASQANTASTPHAPGLDVAEGLSGVCVPMAGTIVEVQVKVGENIRAGQPLIILEAMKMQHVVAAAVSGRVEAVGVAVGDVVAGGAVALTLAPSGAEGEGTVVAEALDPDILRADLAALQARRELLQDAARPEAVARRRRTSQRTARENLAALFDQGTYSEYGDFAVAAQRQRRTLDDLQKNTPADGAITAIGAVNGDLFGPDATRCAAIAYDFTVLAGTQGYFNHAKKDRLLRLAHDWSLPVVLFAEGGGGRPGDVDVLIAPAGLHTESFGLYAGLSGKVPRVGIVSGRCFAGNAALLGCSDIIIATPDANIGMGGPAMIEGGGLGVYRPEEIGPVAVQRANGVIDLMVADEQEAVAQARRYLSYFQGAVRDWTCADQRLLRQVVPENRIRAYDAAAAIDLIADTGSVLRLRSDFGIGITTALIRVEGRPMGLIANNPLHLGGAIDADAADKAARFMQLCEAFGLPILSLIDTPGFMVGPEAEKSAQVRRFSRMFVTGASLSVPLMAIALRKGYGLGAMAMAGGGFHAPFFMLSWPTGEFGGMGLEGAVRLGYRKELEAESDPHQQRQLFEAKLAELYEQGKATSMAAFLEIDSVIDPSETRARIIAGLRALPTSLRRADRPVRFVDTW